MGLRERFGRGSAGGDELSEAARRERAEARAAEREARRSRGPAAKRIGSLASERLRAGAEQGGPRARRALGVGAGVLAEAGRVVLEVFVLVGQAWMVAAELAGRFVLAIWLAIWPPLRAAARGAVAALRLAQRRIEPAHGTVAVALAALAALVVSQFVDYRGISVGTSEYSGGVELVAPAPEVNRERTGDAHAWIVAPIALAGLLALTFTVLGRHAMARLLIPVGVSVLAIALFVDMPKGLDEGSAAIAYDGARAALLEGFWAQSVAGGVLIICGILLPIQLGARGERTRARDGSSSALAGESRPRSRPKAARA